MRDNTVTTEIPARIGGDAGPLYQYDYGQRLIFTGVELPPEYEVHFSNEEKGKSITMIGNSTGVDVPDVLLLTGKDIHVWLYLHAGADDGETAYHVRIRVIRRAEPTHDEPTPVQQDEIEQLIAELIAAVERSESNVLNYPKIVDDEWYVWDAEENDFVGTGIMAKGQDYVLTEEDKVEIAELVGEVVGIPTKVSQLENDSGFISTETDPTVPAWAKAVNKPTYTKSEVGLGNVMNERQYSAQNPPPHDTTKVDTAMVGRANGVAGLDSAGKVPSSQLPSYVDDVVEYPTLNDFPVTGESGKIYIDLSTGKTYRWGGTEYVVIAAAEIDDTAGAGDTDKVWSADKLKGLEDRVADLEYVPITINSLSVSPSLAETGSTQTSASLSYTMNRSATQMELDDDPIMSTSSAGTIFLSSLSLTASKTWTLKATDERKSQTGQWSTKTATMTFTNKVKYGAAAIPDTINDTFLNGLATRTLSTGKIRNFTVTAGAGQYIWYALPSSYGACTFTVGGFSGGFSQVALFTHTNESGGQVEYRVYRSDNANLGTQTVTVT